MPHQPYHVQTVEPTRLLQAALVVLALPVVLGVIVFVVVNLFAQGSSNPQAAGGLATAAAVLIGVLFMLALGLSVVLGVVALIWSVLKGQVPGMQGWVIGFLVALGLYGLATFVISRGPRPF